MANRDDVLGHVYGAIDAVQTAAGRESESLSTRTDLLHDIAGFDSLNALEVVVQISDDLDLEIPERVLRTEGSPPTLTIGALVDRIVAHAEGS